MQNDHKSVNDINCLYCFSPECIISTVYRTCKFSSWFVVFFFCSLHLCHCFSLISIIVANLLKKSLITPTRPNIDKDRHSCIQQLNKTSKSDHIACPVDFRINDRERKQIQQIQTCQVYIWSKAFTEMKQLYYIHVIKVIIVALGTTVHGSLNGS